MCKGLLIAEKNWVNLTSTDNTCFHIDDHTHMDGLANFQPRIMKQELKPQISTMRGDKVNHNYFEKEKLSKY